MLTTYLLLACTFTMCFSSCFSIESNFYREETCAQTGGYCVLENECPHAVEGSFKNLCGDQNKEGAICCKKFPQEQVNCYQSHNECTDECPENLNLGKKGCTGGNTCCLLL